MANLQGNVPTNEYSNRPLPVSRSSNSWMIPAAVVAVIIVLGLGYMYVPPAPRNTPQRRQTRPRLGPRPLPRCLA